MSEDSAPTPNLQLQIDRKELLSGLQSTARLAKDPAGGVAGVRLVADELGIELAATDLQTSLRLPLIGQVLAQGSTVVPAKLLTDVVKSLPEGAVSLECDPMTQTLKLSAGKAAFELKALRADEFPTLPEADEPQLQLATDALAQTLAKVERAVSGDPSRPTLTGVLVQADEATLRMVATDSYRLAVGEADLFGALDGELRALVPARALREAVRLAGEAKEETVGVAVGERGITFLAGATVLTSRLIDGNFPRWEELLPKDFTYAVVLPDGFLEALERVSLLVGKGKGIGMKLEPGTVTLVAASSDVGEASEQLAVAYSGESMQIGFNPEYLKDGLLSAGSGELTLRFSSPTKPGLLDSQNGLRYLIMPIRLEA